MYAVALPQASGFRRLDYPRYTSHLMVRYNRYLRLRDLVKFWFQGRGVEEQVD